MKESATPTTTKMKTIPTRPDPARPRRLDAHTPVIAVLESRRMGRTATSRSPTSTLACADGAQPNPSARARWPTRWLWGQPRARMTRRKVLLMNGSCVVSCNVSSHQTSCVVTMSLIVVCPLDFVSHHYECVTNDRPVVSSNTYCLIDLFPCVHQRSR